MEKLVEVKRGDLVESIHYGDVVVVNKEGRVLAYAGDPYYATYFRSASKPLQALNVLLSGAADRFEFTDQEISIMCASHYGEEFHKKTVHNMLDKIGVEAGKMLSGATLSISPAYARKQLSEGLELTAINSDCSGKHAGMLATIVHKGYEVDDYNSKAHPVQDEILGVVADMCEIDKEKVYVGVDGCSVPVHGMPIYNMALGFAKLANPENLDQAHQDASNRVFQAMNNAPEMVAGTNGFCTELIKHSNGKLVGKTGAEGVYCIGVKDANIGIAVKIRDGGGRATPAVVMSTLEQMGILTAEELKSLENFHVVPTKNDRDDTVGSLYPVFKLKKL